MCFQRAESAYMVCIARGHYDLDSISCVMEGDRSWRSRRLMRRWDCLAEFTKNFLFHGGKNENGRISEVIVLKNIILELSYIVHNLLLLLSFQRSFQNLLCRWWNATHWHNRQWQRAAHATLYTLAKRTSCCNQVQQHSLPPPDSAHLAHHASLDIESPLHKRTRYSSRE